MTRKIEPAAPGDGGIMTRWNVTARVIGAKFLGTFEAASKEEAEAMALKENGYVSLCHQCSGECEDPEIDSVDAWKETEDDD